MSNAESTSSVQLTGRWATPREPNRGLWLPAFRNNQTGEWNIKRIHFFRNSRISNKNDVTFFWSVFSWAGTPGPDPSALVQKNDVFIHISSSSWWVFFRRPRIYHRKAKTYKTHSILLKNGDLCSYCYLIRIPHSSTTTQVAHLQLWILVPR